MDISTLMCTPGAKTGLFRMHRPADVGVPGGLIFLSLGMAGPVRVVARAPRPATFAERRIVVLSACRVFASFPVGIKYV